MKHHSIFNDQAVIDEVRPKYSSELKSSLNLIAPVNVLGDERFDSYYPVSALAVSSIAAVGSSISSLIYEAGLCSKLPEIQVNQRLASLWFRQSLYPVAWDLPPIWDSVAGDYKTSDGWIKLHTNLGHHRKAALKVLGVETNREKVAEAALKWRSDELELEIVSEGGVAAALRSRQEWKNHPQGIAVASEPLIAWGKPKALKIDFSPTSRERPLKGLRVLDLTRVLAGPVATRTLAGLGAEVLRIDPIGWDEANVVPDITLGKRCAFLQLDKADDRAIFESLLNGADVLVHGYRPGALDNLGYGQAVREKLSPKLIEVSLDAYGWTGPWASRRGFDSLVQMSCGIAEQGMRWANANKPTPLPVQALDHATGYLMAAAVIRLLRMAINGEGIANARLSLARTAELLVKHQQLGRSEFNITPQTHEFAIQLELTPWGAANRLLSPLDIEGTEIQWKRSANNLGSSKAHWS
jgi:hypothetical protein